MKFEARYIYNPLRALLVTALILVATVGVGLWVALEVPAVQNQLKAAGEQQLSTFLKTNVTIGTVSLRPFNRIELLDVDIPDQHQHKLFEVDRLSAGIDMWRLLTDGKIVIEFAVVDGLHGHITRPDKFSPTNLQFIIDAFKPKGKKPPTKFDLSINNVVIRDCDVSYDVLSEPRFATGHFDSNHLALSGINADVELPRLQNDNFVIDVKRLAAREHSGLDLRHFTALITLGARQATATGIQVRLPGTYLALQNLAVTYDSLKHIGAAIKAMPLSLRISRNFITPSDLSCFVPALAKFNKPIQISASVDYDKRDLTIHSLDLRSDDDLVAIHISDGRVANVNYKPALSFNFPNYQLSVKAAAIASLTSTLAKLPANVQHIVEEAGNVSSKGAVSGNLHSVNYNGTINTAMGQAYINGQAERNAGDLTAIRATFNIPRWDVAALAPESKVGQVSAQGRATAMLRGNRLVSATFEGTVPYVDYNGYRFHNITANVSGAGNAWQGNVAINDPNGRANASGRVLLNGKNTAINADVQAQNLNLVAMRLMRGKPNTYSLQAHANVTGNNFSNLRGDLSVANATYKTANGKIYHLNGLTLTSGHNGSNQQFTLKSDFLNGNIAGSYDLATLVPAFKGVLAQAFPKWFSQYAKYATYRSRNNFYFNFTLEPNEDFARLVQLPIKIIYKVTADGNINVPDQQFNVTVNAPYLLQGNNLIEGTSLAASFDSESKTLLANVHALVPSKNGKISVNLDAAGLNNQIDADLGWRYNRARDYHGNLSLTSRLLRDAKSNEPIVETTVNPSQIIVNDTVWHVQPGALAFSKGWIRVDTIAANRDQQSIGISGNVAKDPTAQLQINLNDIDLDYVFETLNINHVQFGGRGTGTFTASGLFGGNPVVETPDLHVEGLKYNNAVMGNADIKSRWDNETKGISIDADIAQSNRQHSLVKGQIFLAQDSLYFDFNAHRANVAFMKPFMEAFSSDVQGEVSGHAVLLGNFHTIDLYGDVLADTLSFKLDFTNTYYTCSDSVHMKPGRIDFSNVKIYDRDHHSALLSGWLTHEQFHNPRFGFAITQARDLLCFDTNERVNPRWYGTVYGNGSAFVNGVPGQVDIKLNLRSAPRSKFTFVLTDAEEAEKYDFITYRDRNRQLSEPSAPDSALLAQVDSVPEIVRALARKINKAEESSPTNYQIDLQGEVTPDLQMVLVMDPVGGDKIKATGTGNLHLTYGNLDDQLNMFGTYVLDKGSYNFTLQDIIIKDFTIRNGSAITFQGDPYRALLDIEAIYSLNANLTDLDATFANDRDLSRTSVPVHALLRAKGVISQPDISFDLEFPTLTSESVRKVKSIINTDDMMNRQIVYLLALNRFYTPDYMNNTTSGNELTSVASSTISSQLSNILGQLSDNWSIAPNFHSNKGDFSDTEFDLALSSQLLNNRILFNGNFGYRDNVYGNKNSNFIGDFDLEYLLNRRGTWRLKAYNHFNDQNYYLRNALTTQGVGIVFKHDFDSWRHLFGRKAKKTVAADSLKQSTQSRRVVNDSTTERRVGQ